MRYYGIGQAKDKRYALAACLSYWVFKCRNRVSPAQGTKTWVFLESSIKNSAEVSSSLEDYIQRLCDLLIAHIRPAVLNKIVNPSQQILRVSPDLSELQELQADSRLVFVGWRDLLDDAAQDGFTEWDILDCCRTKSSIVQVLCRLRFEEDRAVGEEEEEVLEVEAEDV